MPFLPAGTRTLLTVCLLAIAAPPAGALQSDKTSDSKKKPTITLRATPATGISPLRVVLTAVIQGGPDDYEEFYCPSIEWDWDDGTKSESKSDCDPYQPGKSEIRRSYTVDHRFETPYEYREYRVQFRLKQKNRTVASSSTVVRVQPGIGR